MKRKRSKYHEEFKPTKAPPEKVAEAIMKSPPKKESEWKYREKLKA